MSFRKELKFRTNLADQLRFKNSLITKGMEALFTSRSIRSVYFDTLETLMLFHSEEGILPRKKVRIRNYNHDLKFKKETKISSMEGRFKTVESFDKNHMSINLNRIKLFDKDYGTLYPKIEVTYLREYYAYRGCRITFDTNIRYKNVELVNQPWFEDCENVIEIKASHNQSLDFLATLIPNSTERFSKYSRGMLITKLRTV